MLQQRKDAENKKWLSKEIQRLEEKVSKGPQTVLDALFGQRILTEDLYQEQKRLEEIKRRSQ